MQPLYVRCLLIWYLIGFGLLGGCTSSDAARDQAAARAAVVGTWSYEVKGFAPLDQGRFRIMIQDGDLQALVRDQRRGRLRARVEIHGSRLELTFGNLRISGYVEDDQFTGSLHRIEWDVRSQPDTRVRSQFQSIPLFAQRVRSAAAVDKPEVLECRPLLREKDGCN